jgi:hypothetical protein
MDKKNKSEIISFNQELMSFDLNDITLEELEQRLELALASFTSTEPGFCTSNDCGCPNLVTGCTCNG